ncbi:hypothetical protein EC973_003442 [Apophysomyces ossiformis]|uniref:TPR-like protein n=1 Tax=Apophysomyces ossiformis TaxID=679940 RepID=A0A8H7BMM2_9FUNG|nr:hypothetical protein EC973_003442 [Apophysomyces ossiformis]
MSTRYQEVSTTEDPLDSSFPSNANLSLAIQGHSADSAHNAFARSRSRSVQQRIDLEETFDENIDDQDSNESERLLNPLTHSPGPKITNTVETPGSRRRNSRPAVLPVTNDGVFSNMSAKPESESKQQDETPPAYEEAAADSTPPYWQTTVIAPLGYDDAILVEGMPVGSIFMFACYLLVSAGFQFVGFLLTYLLHTSHAAKQGSRTGLGITLIQYGFYIRSRGTLLDDTVDGDNSSSELNSSNQNNDESDANVISYFLMILGWLIIIRSVVDYIRARKMEKIISAEPTPESIANFSVTQKPHKFEQAGSGISNEFSRLRQLIPTKKKPTRAMKQETANSVEAWVLMALVYKDLDDLDYRNALSLSERLYGMDKSNEDYKFLYAKSLHLMRDIDGSYLLLRNAKSVPCLNLFARSCLDLGNLQESYERRQALWREGVAALDSAIKQCQEDLPEDHSWGDGMKATVTTRSHTPSLASMYNLLGEFYAKLDNVRGASIQLWKSLDHNRFKLSAYLQLCDISPDIVGFNTQKLPDEIFKDFSVDTTNLKRCTFTPRSPALPSSAVRGIVVPPIDEQLLQSRITGHSRVHMPALRNHYQEISVSQLKSLLCPSKSAPEQDISGIAPSRSELEEHKDRQIESMRKEIEKDKAEEAFKNKHGLHKKPPAEKPQGLRMEMIDVDVDHQDFDILPLLGNPPRVSRVFDEDNFLEAEMAMSLDEPTNGGYSLRGKGKRAAVQDKTMEEASKRRRIQDASLRRYFSQDIPTDNDECSEEIIHAMNRVIAVLRILANGYLCQSRYLCQPAALELQKLNDQQYDTPLVMQTLGKAYYDAGDCETARVFFRHSFAIAPWFCDVVPVYSTCLWYLEDKEELNLLVYKMKENQSHKYEAYIAAGNWSKCAEGGNNASRWFKKAIEENPSGWYAHALLGYEEWEKGSFLASKQHFTDCMIANKRHYLGWYGMATAYLGMDEYVKAKALLKEALRLHQHHPVILFTMAEILYALEEYEDALHFVSQSLKLKPTGVARNLKDKIAKVRCNNHSLE